VGVVVGGGPGSVASPPAGACCGSAEVPLLMVIVGNGAGIGAELAAAAVGPDPTPPGPELLPAWITPLGAAPPGAAVGASLPGSGSA